MHTRHFHYYNIYIKDEYNVVQLWNSYVKDEFHVDILDNMIR